MFGYCTSTIVHTNNLYIFFPSWQVREAVGVALSILCSNVRLLASSTQRHSQGVVGNMNESFRTRSWDQYLVQHASELAMNIQTINQSDNLGSPAEHTHENGFSNDEIQDDVKWMETVLYSYNLQMLPLLYLSLLT